MNRNLLLFFYLIALLGCKSGEDELKIYDADDVVAEQMGRGRLICKLEENIGLLPEEVSNVEYLTDSTFVVRSADMIYLYNSRGKQLKQIGNIGRGPQEFLSVFNLYASNGKLYLYCVSSLKLLVYDYEGNYICEYKGVNLEYGSIVAVDDRYVYFYRRLLPEGAPFVAKYDIQTQQVVEEYGTLDLASKYLINGTQTSPMCLTEDGVIYGSPALLSVKKKVEGEEKEIFRIEDDDFKTDVYRAENIDDKDLSQRMRFAHESCRLHSLAVQDDKIYLVVDLIVENRDGRGVRRGTIYEVDQSESRMRKMLFYESYQMKLVDGKVRHIVWAGGDEKKYCIYEIDIEK